MLTEAEIKEIKEELRHCPTPQAGAVDALKIVQRHRGWVSDEAILGLAELLDMTPAELDSVATFYNLIFRRPVGRHVIMVCDSISCWLTGQETVLGYLREKLGVNPGETTADGEFTLLPTVCLGHCEQAPAMMIDGEVIGNLTPEKIDSIIERFSTGGGGD